MTAVLSAIGKPRPAVQAAAVHVFFNVVGVLIWVPFIADLAEFVRWVSPSAASLAGTERLAAEVPRQVANAHTAFNVANALLMIGMTRPIARLVRRIVPDRPAVAEAARPLYLDDVYLETPALAIDRLRMEIGHLGDLARGLLARARGAREGALLKPALVESAEEVRMLYESVADYARRLIEGRANESETREIQQALRVANHLHNISDTISVNARSISERLREAGLQASDATREGFFDFLSVVETAVAHSTWAFVAQDRQLAERGIELKPEVYRRARELEQHLARRLMAGDKDQLLKYRLESEVLELFKRIYYFAKRIAKNVAEDVVEPEVEPEEAV